MSALCTCAEGPVKCLAAQMPEWQVIVMKNILLIQSRKVQMCAIFLRGDMLQFLCYTIKFENKLACNLTQYQRLNHFQFLSLAVVT